MKLNLETKYDILDKVEYKSIGTFAVLEDGELKKETKQSQITTIDIQVGQLGNTYVSYGMKNGDKVCSDYIIRRV